jgi:hypothetical protein
MEKIDFKKSLKPLYAPTSRDFEIVEVPPMQFVMIDGQGDPNSSASYAASVGWLYAISYAIKFASKAAGLDYTVPPLEALWWSDDMADFSAGRRDRWRWTVMLMAPDAVSPAMFEAAREKATHKLGEGPESLRFERYAEGLSVQFLHVGSYADEAPMIRRMHEAFIPANGLVETGHHHEIYLSDPRRVVAEKLKTVVRQPVKRLA